MELLPDHIILDIYNWVIHKHDVLNYTAVELMPWLLYGPSLAMVSKRFYHLYWYNYKHREKYIIFLCRMGVFPLFKTIYNRASDISDCFLNHQKITSLNQSLSKYPLDHYLIIRLKDTNSASDILLDPHNHENKYYLLDKIKEQISFYNNKEQRFFYDGLYHTYLDLYHTEFTCVI